jgi:hypothetical protein
MSAFAVFNPIPPTFPVKIAIRKPPGAMGSVRAQASRKDLKIELSDSLVWRCRSGFCAVGFGGGALEVGLSEGSFLSKMSKKSQKAPEMNMYDLIRIFDLGSESTLNNLLYRNSPFLPPSPCLQDPSP